MPNLDSDGNELRQLFNSIVPEEIPLQLPLALPLVVKDCVPLIKTVSLKSPVVTTYCVSPSSM